MIPQAGQPAPEFELPNQIGEVLRLKDLRGTWVLVYFYPKDDTPGCTKEACGLRDGFAEFRKAGMKIIGISVDAIASHRKFVRKYDLPFDLLSDEKKEVVKSYGVWGRKSFLGKEFLGTHRVSFLIDPNGKIVKVYPKVNPEGHAAEVLKDLSVLILRT